MENKKETRILIAGDICPTKCDEDFFANGDIFKLIDDEIYDIFKSSDYRICNLETVLSNRKDPIEKCGPALSASPDAINALKKLGIDFAGLSNNHIMDYGENGAVDTIKHLAKNGIAYSGIGSNIEEASKPYYVSINGMKLGILCCCEHEFSVARYNSFGAYAFDPLYTLDIIRQMRSQCDFVLVLYHGGKELYRYPSPRLRQICMRCIDCGADIVVCQHSHCIGAEQNYLGKKILYGQGNFLFNRKSDEFWDTGLIIIIRITEDIGIDILYHPIVNQNGKKCLADGSTLETIQDGFNHRSRVTDSEEQIERIYRDYALSKVNDYYRACLGGSLSSIIGKIQQKIFHKTNWGRSFKFEDTLKIENFIDCEAHHELFVAGLQEDRRKRKQKHE